jgi:LDH2 family malate/lactate/ureidoglycolate dehydrogenase
VAIEAIEGKRGSAADLTGLVSDLLAAAGVDQPSADATARAVVDASSRGVDTHGVRLAPWYVKMVEGGRINRRPNVAFALKSPAVGHVDSDNGFGHRASFLAVEEGCAIAARTGIAAVTVGRSTHHGATGVYTLAAARKGFAALGMTHADSMVVPHGGAKAFYGTNPISFAVPVPDAEPMLLDMATSSIPFNRVFLRRATGTPLPAEVAVDENGETTRDPHAAAALHSLGGDDFGYKGAGLAAMVDILCSAFTGMGHGATFAPFGGPDYCRPIPIGHFFLILNPATFQALSMFDARIAAFLDDLRSTPARPGQRVMAPGDPEIAEAELRRRDGIPVDRVTWQGLVDAAMRYGVAVPDVRDTAETAGAEEVPVQ